MNLRKKAGTLLLSLALALSTAAGAFAQGTDAQEVLDGAELEPQSLQSEELGELVEETMDELCDEEMGTYDKVAACYDYLVENMSYGNQMRYLNVEAGDTTCADIYYDCGEVEGFAAVALTSKVGYCNGYASALIVMLRTLGIDARLVEGETGSANGGYAYHKWAEADIGGTTYLFDPQLEQDLTAAGLPAYSVFCKTYGEVGDRYIKY